MPSHPRDAGLLSVIIPVHREAAALDATLKSLSRQAGNLPRMEILVANDGGDEHASAVCRRRGAREIPVLPRGGSYRARNAALTVSQGARLGFVDAGNIVSPDWCAQGWRALDESDYAGGPICFIEPDAPSAAYAYQVAWAFPVEAYLERNHFMPTANLFIRWEVFEALGCFDERLQSGGDLELGRRIFESRRFRQRYCPSIQVRHPVRTLLELFRKQCRVRAGQADLYRLYPDRFPEHGPNWRRIARSILPPRRARFNAAVPGTESRWLDLQAYAVTYLLRLHGGLLDLRSLLLG